MNDQITNATIVTRIANTKKDSTVQPIMSYTAVTTHKEMATAFVKEILKMSQRVMPDHVLSIEDLVNICHIAIDKRDEGVAVLEGRQLRSKINDQVSRADRYKEPFSIIVVKLFTVVTQAVYDSIMDTLCERMRQTDLLFSFKTRIVLLMPHTEKEPSDILVDRIKSLISNTVKFAPKLNITSMTYPANNEIKRNEVLDWAEDQLRKT